MESFNYMFTLHRGWARHHNPSKIRVKLVGKPKSFFFIFKSYFAQTLQCSTFPFGCQGMYHASWPIHCYLLNIKEQHAVNLRFDQTIQHKDINNEVSNNSMICYDICWCFFFQIKVSVATFVWGKVHTFLQQSFSKCCIGYCKMYSTQSQSKCVIDITSIFLNKQIQIKCFFFI